MNSKILILSHEYPPLGGGAGIMASLLCGELHRRGFSVEVWTNRPPQKERRSFAYPVNYFSSPRKARFSTHFPAMITYIANVMWRGATKKKGKTALVFSSMAIPAGIAGWALSTLWKVPHGIWYLGSDVHGGKETGPGFLQKILLGFLWKRTRYNCFASRGLLNAATLIKPVLHSAILPMAVEFPPVESAPIGSAPVFLFAGRLDPVKNPLFFLEAVKRYNQMETSGRVEFHMVGSGKLQDEVEKVCRENQLTNVSLRPAVSREEMPGIYQTAYALVMTSRREGFPLNVLEAGRCGVPAIGAGAPGLNEVILDGETGVLYKQGDPQSLANAIAALVSESKRRDALGNKARQWSLEFSCEKMTDSFLQSTELKSSP